MPKIYYPDNFKIEVVKHYKMHRNIDLTLEKYGIARSTLFKWKKKYEENYFFRISKQPTATVTINSKSKPASTPPHSSSARASLP